MPCSDLLWHRLTNKIRGGDPQPGALHRHMYSLHHCGPLSLSYLVSLHCGGPHNPHIDTRNSFRHSDLESGLGLGRLQHGPSLVTYTVLTRPCLHCFPFLLPSKTSKPNSIPLLMWPIAGAPLCRPHPSFFIFVFRGGPGGWTAEPRRPAPPPPPSASCSSPAACGSRSAPDYIRLEKVNISFSRVSRRCVRSVRSLS